jgi:hypothetical protein
MTSAAFQESFEERADRLSAEWRARYGVDDQVGWSDAQLDRALADAGFPPLATLPTEAQGMMRQWSAGNLPDPGVTAAETARRWQRVNAAHLIAHAMMHGGLRCGGCETW